MSEKRFALRIIANALILIGITILTACIFNNTIITNDIALGQMANSDEAYLLMEQYNSIRNITIVSYGWLVAIIVGTTIYDIKKFTTNKGET